MTLTFKGHVSFSIVNCMTEITIEKIRQLMKLVKLDFLSVTMISHYAARCV